MVLDDSMYSRVPALEVCGLTKCYGRVEALRGVDLTVEPGEMFALLGPNGAGKTSLFSILATLRTPTAGSARVFGHDVVSRRAEVRRMMGIVFQEPAVEPRLSGRDSLRLMGMLYGLGFRASLKRADEVIESLGMQDHAKRRASDMSGGQRRKLELARALMTKPQILFLDEATLGLDVDARKSFWDSVRQLSEAGHTIFFTTHYMEEADVADRIALVDTGRIVAVGSPAELKNKQGRGAIRLMTEDNPTAESWLRHSGLDPIQIGEVLSLYHPTPESFLPEILRQIPVRVTSVSVHSPSLEDVFLELTGRGLVSGRAALVDAQGTVST